MAIYKIGSFNTHNLSWTVDRDLERIAKIIRQNNLDIVALQEVLSEGKRITGGAGSQKEEILEQTLKHHLGPDWACYSQKPDNHQTSKYPYPYIGNDSREEGYAFLWNTKRIELPVIRHKTVYPSIWSNYQLKNEPNLLRLIRDPLVGRFKLKGRNVELRLITTHIIFGKPAQDNMAVEIDVGAITMRRNEFKILAGDIYAKVSDHRRDMDNVVPYTIILGDYNLNLRASGAGSPMLEDEIICFDKRGLSTLDQTRADRTVRTVQCDRTTLQAGDGYANNYDHFSFDERVEKQVFRQCYAIDAVHGNTEKMSRQSCLEATQQPSDPNSPFEIYRKKVSDHLPIVIELDL